MHVGCVSSERNNFHSASGKSSLPKSAKANTIKKTGRVFAGLCVCVCVLEVNNQQLCKPS